MRFRKKYTVPLFIIFLYIILLIPFEKVLIFESPGHDPFIWNKDALWQQLEQDFLSVRALSSDSLDIGIEDSIEILRSSLDYLSNNDISYDDPVFYLTENTFFRLATMIAVRPERLNDYIDLSVKLRNVIKAQSVNWDMSVKEVRHLTYRKLYGMRKAVEEVILQNNKAYTEELMICNETKSKTPYTVFNGLKIHSGDILLSRGGAPTSALISRGSDYPGNYSHAALVHVDEESGNVSVTEALIEYGVVINSKEDYVNDKKLRIMVLRLRPDHPMMVKDPLLPHKAAEYMLKKAMSRHIPYDFEMDFNDHEKMFCSEVVSAAYGHFGINLWMKMSTISSEGLINWLGDFGVRNFETQEPSDLEYDPQLIVIAEWRGFGDLLKDRIDNAITDVRLERADQGETLTYNLFLLPIARVLKGYSSILNGLGMKGPIPEGMNSITLLKLYRYESVHKKIKGELLKLVSEFEENNGYSPPYWKKIELVKKVML